MQTGTPTLPNGETGDSRLVRDPNTGNLEKWDEPEWSLMGLSSPSVTDGDGNPALNYVYNDEDDKGWRTSAVERGRKAKDKPSSSQRPDVKDEDESQMTTEVATTTAGDGGAREKRWRKRKFCRNRGLLRRR